MHRIKMTDTVQNKNNVADPSKPRKRRKGWDVAESNGKFVALIRGVVRVNFFADISLALSIINIMSLTRGRD